MESRAHPAGGKSPTRLEALFLPQGRSKSAVFGQKTQAAVRIAMDSPQAETLRNQVD
jgi:hypothetical protein